jgi:hypothetical protein
LLVPEGVGTEVEALPAVGSADAVCAQYGRPDAVAFALQVCLYQVEPMQPNRCCNLFAKEMVRAALADEAEQIGPEVPFVGKPHAKSSGAEWLAGAASGPQSGIVAPSSKPGSVCPATGAGEEMTLPKSSQVSRINISNTPSVHFAVGY